MVFPLLYSLVLLQNFEGMSFVGERSNQKDTNGRQESLSSTNFSEDIHEIVSLTEVCSPFSFEQEVEIPDHGCMIFVKGVICTWFVYFDSIVILKQLDDLQNVDQTKCTVIKLYVWFFEIELFRLNKVFDGLDLIVSIRVELINRNLFHIVCKGGLPLE